MVWSSGMTTRPPLTKLLVLLGVAVACWALAIGVVWALVELAQLLW